MIKRIFNHENVIKDAMIDEIINYMEDNYKDLNGEVYVGYPIFVDNYSHVNIVADAVLVVNRGLFVIDILDDISKNYAAIQDDLFTKFDIKLKRNQFLLEGRHLFFDINVFTYTTFDISQQHGYPLYNSIESLCQSIESFDSEYDCNQLDKIIAAIQESYGINERFLRNGATEGSKGMLINRMNEYIEKYDSSQMQAIHSEIEGIQRIRGMAGSGKTVVLAIKAAILHTYHPDWNIVVTYGTRSLKNQFVNLINKFFSVKNDGKLPNYDKLKIMQAWGSEKSNGLYYEICMDNDLDCYSYSTARRLYGKDAFNELCKNVLFCGNLKRNYDCILVDEAQDFDDSFFKLCLRVLSESERLVYAYDELQSLNELTMPEPVNMFGKPIRYDTPLKTCYRNQGNIIVTAHALGMGLYSEDGLIQLPSSSDVWDSIGYSSETDLVEGERVVLYRTPETSPDILGANPDDLISFSKAKTVGEMYEELYDNLCVNLTTDCLNYKDIMIIDLDTVSVNENYQDFILTMRNKAYSFKVHRAGATTPEDFFREDSIVYTSIFRAKGNEAFFVYVLNAQKSMSSLSRIKERNALFTAITRSKGWVKIIGVGDDMAKIVNEFNMIKNNKFRLVFEKYPTKEEQQNLLLNNADIDASDQITIDNARKVLEKLKGKISDEDIVKELLGPDYLNIIDKITKKVD